MISSFLNYFKSPEVNPQFISKSAHECFFDNNIDTSKASNEQRAQICDMYIALYNSTHVLAQQRLSTHSIFLTLHTIFSGSLGYFIIQSRKVWHSWTLGKEILLLLLPYFLIMFLCFIWYRTLQHYNNLNNTFIMITQCLEEYLPVKPIDAIFQTLSKCSGTHDLGVLMKYLPLGFMMFYLTAFMYMIIV